jgi:hypothetical protein
MFISRVHYVGKNLNVKVGNQSFVKMWRSSDIWGKIQTNSNCDNEEIKNTLI